MDYCRLFWVGVTHCEFFWIVVGRSGPLRTFLYCFGSLWVAVDFIWIIVGRCGSFWIVVNFLDRCGSFLDLVSTQFTP